ncbi:MAG: amino acid adenylation domain-containing protein [Nostoc sp.]|uniref:amino acid adenylation domain-containing protein n=1 Tax=Nostoc sp. TaxID=1180 RepID=UPI002FF13811
MNFKNVEDVYPLSPMQQGMLFHSLYTPTSGVYIQQICFELRGQLNVTAFAQAWEYVVARHPALRTAFVWENLEQPLQVVGRQIKLPWEEYSWEGLSTSNQQQKLESLLQKDRQQGFELTRAPLMRFTLIPLGEASHYFIWSHHHLLLDGWSVSIVFQEVIAYYKTLCQCEKLSLEQPQPYRDYIAWLQKQDLSKAEAFWREQVSDLQAPTSVAIGSIAQKLSDQPESYNYQQLQLEIATTNALKSFVQQYSLTLNTLVHGAWALLLSRYSGEQDVIFGATVSGRPPNFAKAESMVGLFINTLPARVHVSPKDLLLPWLLQLQNQQVEARQCEYTPLMEIQKWSQVSQDQPLFESIVVFENYPIKEISLLESGLNLEIKIIHSFERTNYPLTLSVIPGQELSLKIAYDQGEGFDDAVIFRMLEHLETLLKAIVANPQQPLKELQILTEAEKHQLLVEWNQTQVEYAQDQCLHQLFEQQVERTPKAIALTYENQQLTYSELNTKANQLAHYLQKLGVKPQTLVGICIERSPLMIIGLLGILKAGGAYIPIDPSYPQQRVAWMLEDSQTPILLSQQQIVESLPVYKAQIICLDRDWEKIAAQSSDNPICNLTDDHLAYVIYTSGSTGQPKAAMNTHASICNRLLWMQETYQLTATDCVLQKTPFSFDVSVWEFFWTLITGARLVIARPDGHRDPDYLINLIANEQISTLHFVPSMLQVFLQAEGLEKCNCLKRVICSGEALTVELEKRFFARLQAELHNLYGPTEAAIDVTYYKCSANDTNKQSVPIGRPIANTQIYILDQYLNPVPIGITGEIYIGGVGVGKGYLNRPELTTQKFIENPFGDYRLNEANKNPKSLRLYKTGDLARYLPCGDIEYIGRIDHQVKLRGFRIELTEIEAVINKHPSVLMSVVVLREDVSINKILVAYTTLNSEQTLSIPELRHFLESKLPNYMVPTAFIMLEALPLTPNGKIDRKALPAPDWTQLILQSNFVAPSTPIEEILAQIWAEVLGLNKVGIHNNFFELGGDSIITIQVITKANQAGIKLEPRQLFQYQTIAELAKVASVNQAILAEKDLIAKEAHLTPIQHWLLARNQPDVHRQYQSLLLEMQQRCDRNLLEQVVQHLIEHHDALRLCLIQNESGWRQIHANPDETIVFTHVNLSALPEIDQELAIEAWVAELQANLDLSTGPLVRFVFFDLIPPKTSRLLIIAHHLIIDNISWQILLADLQIAYQQISQGQGIDLPKKTTSFQRWTEYLQEYAQSSEITQEQDYWLAEIRKQFTSLPVDYISKDNQVAHTESVSVSLNKEETQALLKDIHKAYNTKINDVLLTALVQTFAKWTKEHWLWVDIQGNSRDQIYKNINLSRTIGCFITCFPVFLEITEVADEENAVIAIKERLHSIPNQGIGYGLLRYLSSNPEIKLLPQAEVSFNYLGEADQIIYKSSLFQKFQVSKPASRVYLLEINAIIVKEQFQFNWTYSNAIHRRETITTLAQDFIEALQSLITHCQSQEVERHTPSDFPKANLSQQKLDRFLAQISQASENKYK